MWMIIKIKFCYNTSFWTFEIDLNPDLHLWIETLRTILKYDPPNSFTVNSLFNRLLPLHVSLSYRAIAHPSSRFSAWSSPSGILEKASFSLFFSFFFSFLDSVLLKFWITPSFSFSGPFVSVLWWLKGKIIKRGKKHNGSWVL